MLALTRKQGEIVQIGRLGSVVVSEIREGAVVIGFDFPYEIQIIRGELVRESQKIRHSGIPKGKGRRMDPDH